MKKQIQIQIQIQIKIQIQIQIQIKEDRDWDTEQCRAQCKRSMMGQDNLVWPQHQCQQKLQRRKTAKQYIFIFRALKAKKDLELTVTDCLAEVDKFTACSDAGKERLALQIIFNIIENQILNTK